MKTSEIKSNEGWSSQLWTQYYLCNCVRSQKKNSGLQRNLNPWPCDTHITRSWVQIPLKSWIYFMLLMQLHKLCSQLRVWFLIWRILMLITSWDLTSLAIICLQEVWMQYFYHLWYDHFTHRKMTFKNSNISRGKNSSYLPICFATFRAAMTSVLPSIPIENVWMG